MRFIPTGVGNTFASSWRRGTAAVHPHGRGEHDLFGVGAHTISGSSPRAWGTHATQNNHAHRRRFIPTGVGNTASSPFFWLRSTVHPHGRGEHAVE